MYCELCDFATYDATVLQVHYNGVHFGEEDDEPTSPPASPIDEGEWLSCRRPGYTYQQSRLSEALMILSFLLFGEVDYGMVWRFAPHTIEVSPAPAVVIVDG